MTRGRILVVGGGISGITAAIEASEAGAEAILVEREPYLGGKVATWSEYFPKLCPPACGLEINLRRIRTSPRIRCLTLAEVVKISGGPGDYQVTVRRNPRFVNERCTVCNACVEACPVERPDTFNAGMSSTKAIYRPFDTAHPPRHVIDGDACPGAECGKCLPACAFDAIDLSMQPETLEFDVQAVVWATGWEPPDATRFEGLGFGASGNVINNVMMERLAARNGPTAGKIVRPTDGKEVTSVVFVQCAGSRDDLYLRQCSGVCCLASLKQARYVRARCPDAEIHVFYIDIRAPGRFEDFYAASKTDERLHLIRGKVGQITEQPDGRLRVEAEDTLSGERVLRDADLVVLATGMAPAGAGSPQLERPGLAADDYGFLLPTQPQRGFLATGCAKRPADVGTCVRDATGVAMQALQLCGDGSSDE